LRRVDGAGAVAACDRARAAVAAAGAASTISIGVATLVHGTHSTIRQLVVIAADNLQRAKAAGGNRVLG
jgi:PleD family two-component response regulator